jgi:hypothetical protein
MTAAIKKRLHGRFNLVSGKEKKNTSSRKDKPWWTPIGDSNTAYRLGVEVASTGPRFVTNRMSLYWRYSQTFVPRRKKILKPRDMKRWKATCKDQTAIIAP